MSDIPTLPQPLSSPNVINFSRPVTKQARPGVMDDPEKPDLFSLGNEDHAAPLSEQEKQDLSSDSDSDPRHIAVLSAMPATATTTSPEWQEHRQMPQGQQHPRPNVVSRAATGISTRTTTLQQPELPPLKRAETRLAQKESHPWQHIGITLGLPMIILFDLVVPCIIYYTWYDRHTSQWRSDCNTQYPDTDICPIPHEEFDKDILGSAIASFGVGELWILIARVWRLFFRRDECAPLLSRNRWELDATSWVYAVAMIVALVPFTVGSSLELPKLYLYGPSFLMAFLGSLMIVTTLLPFKLPIGINSHARGSGLRPFIYYAAEDFVAVDGLQDREFRVRYNDRYESNPMFRRFFLVLTLWWMLGVCVYIGCVSAVIWTLPFHIAFGLSLGILFSYIATWAGVTVLWVNFEMRREHEAFQRGDTHA